MDTISWLVDQGHDELVRLNPPAAFETRDHPVHGQPSLTDPEETPDGQG